MIKGVSIGDRFYYRKNTICKVVDFYEVRSMTKGTTKGVMCMVQAESDLCNSIFEVPFATVVRRRINK